MLTHPHSRLQRSHGARRGFTLIELLTTMTIILILAGIVISVGRGVSRKQDEAKAKGELQAIATALESFKLKYGDYPWLGPDSTTGTGNATALFDALTGQTMLYGDDSDDNGTVDSVLVGTPPSGRAATSFLTASNMTVDDDTNPTYFEDPWGNPYRYYYVDAGAPANKDNWNNAGFILLSAGPDGVFNDNQNGYDYSIGRIETNSDDYYIGGDPDNSDNIVYGLEF